MQPNEKQNLIEHFVTLLERHKLGYVISICTNFSEITALSRRRRNRGHKSTDQESDGPGKQE